MLRPLLHALLAIIAFTAIMLRMPEVVYAPRFWAEESLHFGAVVNGGFSEALTFVYWRAGYYNLVANIGSALAAALPLALAPTGVLVVSFIVQMIPVYIVLGARGAPFDHSLRKAALLAAVVLLPTIVSEIWLNTINSQIFLGVSALLIALDSPAGARAIRRLLLRVILVLASLSGAYSVLLQPVYLFRWWVSRGREELVQAGIVTACLIVQVALLVLARSQGVLNEKRTFSITLDGLSQIPAWHLGYPFLGSHAAELGAQVGGLGTLVFVALFAAALVAGLWDKARRRFAFRHDQIILIAAYLCWTGGILVTSLHGDVGGRYAFPPSFVVVALVITSIRRETGYATSAMLTALVVLCLVSGLRDYRLATPCSGEHPVSWAREAERAENRPGDTVLPICPDGWVVKLR